MITPDPGPTVTTPTRAPYTYCGTDFAATNDSTVVVYTDGTGSNYEWIALDDPPQPEEPADCQPEPYDFPAPWEKMPVLVPRVRQQNIAKRRPLICRSGRRSSATGVRNFRRQQ